MAFPRAFRLNGPQASTKSKIRFLAKLDGITLKFKLYWNQRFSYWELTVFTDSGDIIIHGIRVVADWDLFGPYSDDRLPPGSLWCKDPEELGENPGRNDLRERHFFMYTEEPVPEPLGVAIKPQSEENPPV